MKQLHLFLLLSAMLLMVGSGRLKAEDGQPRIYIPSVEFSDNGKFGFSAITPKNPYFTLYVWYKNTDHNHAYWMENPKLEEVITNSYTEDPFALVANANTTLKWTDPGKLTFTVYIVSELTPDGLTFCRKMEINK